MLKFYDIWIFYLVVVFYFLWVLYYYIYVGVLDVYIVYYFGGGYGYLFYKLYILKYIKLLEEEVFVWNKISGDINLIKLEEDFFYKFFYERKEDVILCLIIKKVKS